MAKTQIDIRLDGDIAEMARQAAETRVDGRFALGVGSAASRTASNWGFHF